MRRLPWQITLVPILFLIAVPRSSVQTVTPTVRPELVLQTGHTSGIFATTFGPNGEWLATGGADNVVRIWDVSTGRELRALRGHTGWIKSLAASKDSDLLVSAGNDRVIRLWNVKTGELLKSFTGHAGPIDALVFASDGRWFVSGSSDKTVRIWNVQSDKETATLSDHTGGITSLTLSPDGKLVASGSSDTTIKIWEVATGRNLSTLTKHTQKISALIFSADSASLVSGSAGGEVMLWRVGKDEPQSVMKHNATAVLTVFINADSISALSTDRTLTVWNTKTGKQQKQITVRESDEISVAAFNSTGTRIAETNGSRTVELRRVDEADPYRTLESRSTGFYSVATSPDGKWIAAGTHDHAVRVWQVATGRELPRLVGHKAMVSTVAFNKTSRLLAAGSISGEVRVWDVIAGRESFTLPQSKAGINSIAFSSDGKTLATAGGEGQVLLFDVDTKQSRSLRGPTAEITSIAYSADGKYLAAGSIDKTVTLWELQSPASPRTIATLSDQVNAIGFSPDSSQLAVGGADQTITIWNVSTGSRTATLTGSAGKVLSLTFTPDGTSVLSGGSDQKLRIWEAASGKQLNELDGGAGDVNSVVTTPDGHWILSAGGDGSILVWSAKARTLAATLVSMRGANDWLVVTPDGLFDGSPASWRQILWRFGGSTFSVSPVEAFFNEFYYPAVLADIFAGNNPKPVLDISRRDRRQPQLTLALANDYAADSRTVTVRVDINEAPADRDHAAGSGARDVRLFRNGLLVKAWTGNVLNNKSRETLQETVPVVAGDNQFTVYAFNNDNVKSSDASLSVTGSPSLKRTGTAFVLAIGVGEYENPAYSLNYSVADATALSQQLKNQQERLKRYDPFIVIPLLNREATKANILHAIRRLAGTETDQVDSKAPAILSKIPAAQPEDIVIIYFSGHGTAQKDHFYLLPHDLGYLGPRGNLGPEELQTILAHSVSDIELEDALRPMDVDQLLLVIDACNSGQALDAAERRRGPMNTRGLAQLAYEKGMYILTASQSVEVAFESAELKHSYLAYALVEEGIVRGAADENRDGQVLLSEWFGYATERVPRMGRDLKRGTKDIEEVDPDERRVQRPRVFYTRETEAQRMVIAQVSHAVGK